MATHTPSRSVAMMTADNRRCAFMRWRSRHVPPHSIVEVRAFLRGNGGLETCVVEGLLGHRIREPARDDMGHRDRRGSRLEIGHAGTTPRAVCLGALAEQRDP